MLARRIVIGVALCILACNKLPAAGVVIFYQASAVYSGFTPQGPAPWVTVKLDDGGGQGSVEMTLSATSLPGSEFISDFYLQLNPSLDPRNLVFSAPTKVGSFTAPTISLGHDKFKAGPMDGFDIELSFATSGSNGGSKRFSGGESVTYTIQGISTLTADSFHETGSCAGQPFAAHVQGITACGKSAWVTVPEPASLSLLVLACVATLRRRTAAVEIAS